VPRRLLFLAVFSAVVYGQAEDIKDLNALKRRSEWMLRLIREDPARAVSEALPDSGLTALRARFPEAAARIEQRGEWEGPFTVLVQDSFPHLQSRTVRWIRVDGREIEVHWPGGPDSSCANRIRIRGIRLGNHIAVEEAQDATAPPVCTTTGQQNVAVLLVNYKTIPLPAWFTTPLVNAIFFEPGWSMDQFWRENSFGVTTASGSVFGPFNLNDDYSCYQNDELRDAAIQAADSVVDLRNYTRIFIVAPNTDDCWWSGMSTVGCVPVTSPSKGDFSASVTWIMTPAAGTREMMASLASHESGHGFGLNHSRSLDYDTVPLGPPGVDGKSNEYGDVFSNMGTSSGQWPAPQKSFLGWFSDPAAVQEVDAPGTFLVAPYETQTSSVQALRIRRGPGNDQWLWLEYRQPLGLFDGSLSATAFGGALIHYEDAANPPGTYTNLLDFRAARRPNDFHQAPLPSGSSWQDPYSPLSLTIGDATSNGLRVSVAYDEPCATLLPSSSKVGSQAQEGVFSISAPTGCSWTAASTADWITISGGQSGAGSGTISYSLDPNTSDATRTGIILAGRQRFAITQQLRWPNLIISMTHRGLFGHGGSGTFVTTVMNSGGAATTTPVGVSSNPGPGLSIAGITGAGWTCSTTDFTCWRADALAPGQSYPPLIIKVSVALDAPSIVNNQTSALLMDESGTATVVATRSDVAQTGSPFDR
jgi:M6 family metalloprotease-like protein